MNIIKLLQIALVIIALAIGFSTPVVNGLTLLSVVLLAAVGVIGYLFKEPMCN